MNLLQELNKVLAGRKTYLVAAILALGVFAVNVGWIDQHTYDTLYGILVAAGLATLRAGVGK